MHVGIDLGTTFSCVAYVDDNGEPRVIPSSDREPTTPSVVWFDGKQAYVGRKANGRKVGSPHHIYEFVKREMGKPVEISSDLYDPYDPDIPQTYPCEIDGFKFGAAGMSAIILRKLKKEAVGHFKRIGRIDRDADEKMVELEAVITVPAYFGDRERQQTALAGYAAGLKVVGIINEPTAAALSYGFTRANDQRLMVFDLGGGTFDVTVLQVRDGEAEVITSGGDNSLGGRDWDALVEDYIYAEFRRRNGRDLPDARGFEVQEAALHAKLALSEDEETTVSLSTEEGELDVTLYRSSPAENDLVMDMDMSMDDNRFHFEQRAAQLLHRCRVLCEHTLARATLPTPGGGTRALEWSDLDEILLAGGSCRMPMVGSMLERVSGRRVRRHVEGFDYDTAIALGAALYGKFRSRVRDVVSHGIGVKLMHEGRYYVDHLIVKDTPLPTATVRRTYTAGPNAVLEVYEGDSRRHDECVLLGRLEMDNVQGTVGVLMRIDADGILRVTADFPPDGHREMELRNELYMSDPRKDTLRERIAAIHINL
jgi:molecular chaperone DnaK